MTVNRTLPDSWRWVRFGDVVRQAKETTKDPDNEGLTRIVGLEQLDPESLPLRRWHELDELPDGTSFTRVFRAGQVLFGKRRAYQRKVAVADFDGVCSGDILVFEASGDEMLAEFLPYLVQSDGFFDHALGTSAGSLSPRTKWQELAKYEFALPPKDVQYRLAEILIAATDTVSATARAYAAAQQSLASLSAQFVQEPKSLVSELEIVGFRRLDDVAHLRRGRFSYRPRNEPRLYAKDSPYPFIQTGDLQRSGRYVSEFSQYLSEEGTTYSKCVPGGTLLITIAAVIGATAYTTCETYLPDSIVSVIPRDGLEASYVELLLHGLRSHLETRVATENTQRNLSVARLGSVTVPIVKARAQNTMVSLMDSSWMVVQRAEKALKNALAVETQLREQLLAGNADV